MTVPDAVYAVALYRYVVERAKRGEHATELTARKVALLASALGIRPKRTAAQLGFASDCTLPSRALRLVQHHVRETGGEYLVHRLSAAINDLSVAQLDAYGEE